MSHTKNNCSNTNNYLTMLDSAMNDGKKNSLMVRQLTIYTNEQNKDIITFTNNSTKARLFIRALKEHDILPRIRKSWLSSKTIITLSPEEAGKLSHIEETKNKTMEIFGGFGIDPKKILYKHGKTSLDSSKEDKNPDLITLTLPGQSKGYLEYLKPYLSLNQENVNIKGDFENGQHITIAELNVDLVNSLHSKIVGNSKNQTSAGNGTQKTKSSTLVTISNVSRFGGESLNGNSVC